MGLMLLLLLSSCSGNGEDSSVSGESDTDADTDTDTDTDADTDAGTPWAGLSQLPPDGIAIGSAQDGDQIGLYMAVGDFDGDGHQDLVAPAIFRTVGAVAEAGEVFIARGPFTTDTSLTDAWASIEGDSTAAYLGTGVAAVPDLDGDGADELLAAAPFTPSFDLPNGNGTVYLFEGLGAGQHALTEADEVYVGEDSLDGLGLSLAIGDIDADGTADLLMGAPFSDENGTNSGVVYGLTDPSTQPANAALRLYGLDTNANLGKTVTNVGDLDADGIDDFAVSEFALLRIFHGPLTGPMLASDSDATIATKDGGFGIRSGGVASAGDIDGDGRSDMLAGAYSSINDDGLVAGVAWLFGGSELDDGEVPTVLSQWKVEGVDEGELVGFQVASAGDADGDGHGDVFVSASEDPTGGTDAGAVYYFEGPLNGTAALADRQAAFESTVAYAALGTTLVPAVDVTGDGYADAVLGAPQYQFGGPSAIYVVPGLGP